MEVSRKEYQGHRVFTDLERYADFYGKMSMSAFPFVSVGVGAGRNIDTYTYSSIQGTLESIKIILSAGRINDAYALLRKYHDSAVINIYANLYLKENFSIENFVVEKIDNWLSAKERLPEYRALSQYIKKSQMVKSLNDVVYVDDRYKKIRDRCNDHTHYNFYHHVMLNDNEIHNPNRMKWLDRLAPDIQDLFIFHFAYVFYLNDVYMMSSDYMDALECDMQPEEGSQQWVASFIQEMFDETFRTRRPDIYDVLKENTAMELA